MHGQRTGVVVGFVLVLAATAGCLGAITGQEPLAVAANETVVADGPLEQSGYGHANNQTIVRTMNVVVAGQERRATVTSHLHVYERTVDLSALDANAARVRDNTSTEALPGTDVIPSDRLNRTGSSTATPRGTEAAQFAVLATPGASIGGVNANPLASMSTAELVERFLETRPNGTLTFEGNRTVESMGAPRTVSTYRAGRNASAGGDALLHVARFEVGGDVVVVVAGHPALVDERERVDRLLAGLERTDG